jgi:trafficking protein particle complex subunit 12
MRSKVHLHRLSYDPCSPLMVSPLSSPVTPISSPLEPGHSTTLPDPLEPPGLNAQPPSSPSTFAQQPGKPLTQDKDLSFLLDPSIYHPLSQLDIPLPLRQQLPPPPTADTPLLDSLTRLDKLLSTGKFLSVASLAASILVSGSVRPNDSKTIFDLLALRYSCLELTGNGLLAAQESKALEDINSALYYVDQPLRSRDMGDTKMEPLLQENIIPFSLRLQALRLQAIGFSDPHHGISALYDLGLECREHAASPFATSEDREVWSSRLSEVGIKVVNALIEMGDLDCATRTLTSIKPSNPKNASTWQMRMVLLYLKIGDLSGAQKLMQGLNGMDGQAKLLQPLLAFADGRYEEAALAWEKSLESGLPNEEAVLAKQNLAVACLYSGQIERTRDLMEGLVDEGNSFQSLLLNLATLYELSSDKSRELKVTLAGRVAQQEASFERGWTKTNADFKL